MKYLHYVIRFFILLFHYGKGRTKEEALLIEKINKIAQQEYHQSIRKNDTGIGATYESLLGITENNKTHSDLHGFEIKTHRAKSNSYITLFTKKPTYPPQANTHLRKSYGNFTKNNMQILHVTVSHSHVSSHVSGHKFTLKNDNNMLRLIVMDTNDNIIDDTVCWDYDIIADTLHKKMRAMAYVSTDVKKENGIEYFHYNKAELYSNPVPMDEFIKLVEAGDIVVDLRIGVHKSGNKKGRTHDHGTAFRTKQQDLCKLYKRRIK